MKLVVVFENGKKRERHTVGTVGSRGYAAAFLSDRMRAWMRGALNSAEEEQGCRSFTVGVHLDSAECDHETEPKP